MSAAVFYYNPWVLHSNTMTTSNIFPLHINNADTTQQTQYHAQNDGPPWKRSVAWMKIEGCRFFWNGQREVRIIAQNWWKNTILALARTMSRHPQLPCHRVFIALIKRLGTVIIVNVYLLISLDMIVAAVVVMVFAKQQLPIDDLHMLNVRLALLASVGKNPASITIFVLPLIAAYMDTIIPIKGLF